MGLAPPSIRRMNYEDDLDGSTWHRCADWHSAAPAFANPGYTGKSGVEFYGGKPGGFAPGPAFADPGNSGTGFAPGPAPALPAPSNNSASLIPSQG